MDDDMMPEVHFESLDKLERSYWWHQHRVRMAVQFFKSTGLTKPSVLDIGCGTGGFMQQFAEMVDASSTVGIETSPLGLKACREKGLDVLDQDLMDPLVLPREDFDIATAMDVLEHLPDERPALQLVHKNLKPRGRFIISVPALPSMWSSWDEHLNHFRRYTVPTLRSVLEEEGFEIECITYGFGFALIPAKLRRLMGEEYDQNTCEFPPVPAWVNALLMSAGKFEAGWLKYFNVPLGLSVFAVAKKRPGA